MGISCCVMLILCLNHIFLFYSLSSFPTFSFLCVCHSDSPISYLGCLYSLCVQFKDTADLVLWFPDRTFVCTHPRHQNDLIVFMVLLNPYQTKNFVAWLSLIALTVYLWLCFKIIIKFSLINMTLTWPPNILETICRYLYYVQQTHRPCGLLVSFKLWHEQFSHIKSYISLCSYAQ